MVDWFKKDWKKENLFHYFWSFSEIEEKAAIKKILSVETPNLFFVFVEVCSRKMCIDIFFKHCLIKTRFAWYYNNLKEKKHRINNMKNYNIIKTRKREKIYEKNPAENCCDYTSKIYP